MAHKTSSDLDLRAVDRRLNWTAWAAFFVMWGGTFLIQRLVGVDLRNLQYAGAGAILLGMNAIRYLRGITMSRLTLVIGLLAFMGGIVRQLNGELELIPIVLITAGSLLFAQGILTLPRR